MTLRLVFWNCGMALPRKAHALQDARPDIAVVAECARPDILRDKGLDMGADSDCVWIGSNPNKGLGVFATNGYKVALAEPYHPTLKFIAPVTVAGPLSFHLLAVWAQNASAGISRKHQLGPLRRALSKYRTFLQDKPAIVGGDLNNNAIWDKPGWRANHMAKVAIMNELGLVSAYHELTGEEHGKETIPTHYWRDRKKDGPTYHLDYAFLPTAWLNHVSHFEVGTFETWCGPGMSDHAPIVLELSGLD